MTDIIKAKTYKDIQIDYVLNGLVSIKESYDTGSISKLSLDRANKILLENPSIDSSDLAEWVSTLEKPIRSGRGKGRVSPGDTRNYKVQVTNNREILCIPIPNGIKGSSIPVQLSKDGTQMIIKLSEIVLPITPLIIEKKTPAINIVADIK